MKYNELILNKQRPANRVGRGISGGQGKTAGRGTKGQGARKSSGTAGFEGGQMPLHMRLPKFRGFKSHRTAPQNVNTGQLNALKRPAIDTAVLHEAGLISSPYVSVKLIYKGELTAKKMVKLQGASQSAIKAIEKAGGSFEKVAQIGRAKSPKTDNKTK